MAIDDQPGAGTAPQPRDDAFRIDVDRIQPGKAAAPPTGRTHPKGRFYRPELYSPTEKVASSVGLKVALVIGLVAVTAILLVIAASTGAIL